MEEGVLDIRPVQVVLRDKEFAYISEGLDRDDLVVTTHLATVIEGAALRLQDEQAAE
jgi:hypothetical protein